MQKIINFFKHLPKHLLVWLVVLVFLFEEFIWKLVRKFIKNFRKYDLVIKFEKFLQRQHPYVAVTLFFVPEVSLIPIKLLLLAFIAQGHVVTGITILIIAKLSITAIVAYLYDVNKNNLLKVHWFVWIHDHVMKLKNWVHNKVHATSAYKKAMVYITNVKKAYAHYIETTKKSKFSIMLAALRKKNHIHD